MDSEIVASSINAAIDRIERALRAGANAADEFLLKGELLIKQSQLADARVEERHNIERGEEKSRAVSAAISYLVEKESRLNTDEREQYASFLTKDYFRKSDFKELEIFYRNSWDKLSEEGKEQMTRRVAEGIRQGEYTFEELPDSVKSRESARLRNLGVDTSRDSPAAALDQNSTSRSSEKPIPKEIYRSDKLLPVSETPLRTEKRAGDDPVGIVNGTFDEETAAVSPTDLKTGGSLYRS